MRSTDTRLENMIEHWRVIFPSKKKKKNKIGLYSKKLSSTKILVFPLKISDFFSSTKTLRFLKKKLTKPSTTCYSTQNFSFFYIRGYLVYLYVMFQPKLVRKRWFPPHWSLICIQLTKTLFIIKIAKFHHFLKCGAILIIHNKFYSPIGLNNDKFSP
jgi:hypothetical protein